MGIRGTGTRRRRPAATAARQRQGFKRGIIFAIFLTIFVVALAVVFVRLLPTVRNNPSLSDERQPPGEPAPTAILIPEPAIHENIPPEQPPAEETQPSEPEQVPEPESELAQAPSPYANDIETRERDVFFILVENDGADLSLARVSRALSVSNTPLLDTLNALLAGPTPEEAARGVASFIPPGARLLRAEIRGHTAYINFSEDFQFNTLGSEGFSSQIRQIVWTATEFPNVLDVQILIEGNRVDFLHGDLRIGSPIARDPGNG